MNKVFLSRENTSKLYKDILHENKLQALPRKTKELIVNNLVGNMKEVYKHIDFSKLNNTNFDKILEQFNGMCIKETTRNLKNSQIFSGEDTQVSRLKFARDFNSTKQKKVQFLERPKATFNENRIRSENSSENSTGGSRSFRKQLEQTANSLDNMFQPITNNVSDSNFGYINNRDTTTDINKQMDMISQVRQNETNNLNQRPPTPDFLKSQKTQVRKDYDKPTQQTHNNFNSSQNNFNSSQNNNTGISAINSQDQTNTNELGSYSGGDNYFSFDDMNKPLVKNEIVEDNSSFEDRLKRLQSERTDLPVPSSNSQPPTQGQQQEQMQRQQQEQMQIPQQEQMQRQQQLEQMQRQQQQEQMQRQQQEQMQRQQQEQMQRQQQEQMQRQQETVSSNEQQLKNLLNRLNDLESKNNNNLDLNQINELKNENTKLKNEIEQMKSLKEKISIEFTELNKKNELIQSNMQIMNQRELELNNRENNILQLVNNYKQILNSRFYQMNVSSKDNTSKYSYFFNNISNIISIKIISYSIPQARYNIDMNNNLFKYKIISENNDDVENIEKEIIIPKGKYSIEQLIEYLNEKSELKFSIGINQKITILSDNNFSIENNNLTNGTLGFTENVESIKEELKYILVASNTWDLRLHDKLFLYITNINEDPISIIYFNGNCESQIQFEEPIELSKLDIELKDSYGNLYDFNNLKHSINLQFELTNQFNELVPTENQQMLELNI